MKVMKTPEKVYIDNFGSGFSHGWHTEHSYEKDIEYIRKDVFIEKACDVYCKVCGHYPHTVPTYICRQDCDYFKDFKNHMKE